MLATLHLIILVITLIGVVRADHEGFAWIRGKKPILDFQKLRMYHYWVGTGLFGMIVTGLILLWPMRDYLLTSSPLFILKMIFVALLVVNAFTIWELLKVATVRTFASLSLKEKIPLFTSGLISTGCWMGAVVLGLYLFGLPSF